jgi:tetratricopeptide (TPR) repeat protein
MDKVTREKWVLLIEKASLALLGGLFILFPLIFTTITTDLFILPKQALLISVVLILLVLYGLKTLILEKLSITRTPFDVPILLFIAALGLSSLFSVARYDSLFNFVPVLFAGICFYAITYNIKNQKSFNVLTLSLLIGGALLSVVTVLNLLKVYIFPYEFTKSQTFNPLGSSLDQTIYLGMLLLFAGYFLYPFARRWKTALKNETKNYHLILLSILSLVTIVGFIVSLYITLRLTNPLILPLATGFQTAFASISQDAQRLFAGFLFGAGYGEFAITFLRFKTAAFNQFDSIWNLTFFRSTSFVLELLATTGLVGISSFLFLSYKIVKEKKPFIPLIVIVVLFFVLPLAFYHLTLFFFLLGLYGAFKNLTGNTNYFEMELSLSVSKRGYFVLAEGPSEAKFGRSLSVLVFLILFVFVGLFGFLTFNFVDANITFQKALVFAQQNNGTETYNHQLRSLNTPAGRYVDSYHRLFAQTNLALANSLANSIPQGSSPSAQQQQTIYSLVQQSINSARQATSLSPFNSVNWQNLSSVYRALIGFGDNADSFALLAAQQSAVFDPTNPQEYINLGGIYYQLQAWDRAIEQFQTAVNLKPDLPNAYYNLGFAYWQKGDLQNAQAALERVKNLVADNKENLDRINEDLEKLKEQIAQGGQAQVPDLDQPEPALPPQDPELEIPAPSPVVSPSLTPTPTPSR